MKNIIDKIEKALEANLPFVVYNKPNEKRVTAFFQQNNTLFSTKNYSEKGFVFAPFDDKNASILIPTKFSEYMNDSFISEDISLNTVSFASKDSKEFHVSMVENGIEAIHKNEFRKVVLSRKESLKKESFNILSAFKKLLYAYDNAFVYVWFHPKIGLWMGATPETLLKIKGNTFETMSLAGTQVYKENEEIIWKAKELDEQQLVTDYVLQKLLLVCESVNTSKVETIKAGSLIHLKTKIKGKIKDHPSSLIHVLHPTPAVCGFPKDESKKFILKNEEYDRKFYTGFLGELNMPNSELFVNLRCMEIEKKRINIYVGGGITKDSNPEKEWDETVAKAKTMKNVF